MARQSASYSSLSVDSFSSRTHPLAKQTTLHQTEAVKQRLYTLSAVSPISDDSYVAVEDPSGRFQ